MEGLLLIPELTNTNYSKASNPNVVTMKIMIQLKRIFLFSKMHVFDFSTPYPVKFIKTITKLISTQK